MANEAVQDPLAELRDIHLPAPPELWPPAPGWWILAAIAAVGTCFLLYLAFRYWRRNAYRREAADELESLFQQHQDEPLKLLAATNELLKRVALTSFPRDAVANLSGESWVAFLDSTGGGHEFSMGPGQVLIDGPYSNLDTITFSESELLAVARGWIKQHRVQKSPEQAV
jgi:hypothetical protein